MGTNLKLSFSYLKQADTSDCTTIASNFLEDWQNLLEGDTNVTHPAR